MFALIENNLFVRWVDLRKEFPNTSFPAQPNPSDLPAGVVYVEVSAMPSTPTETSVVELASTPTLEDGVWKRVYVVREMNTQELSKAAGIRSAQVRYERDQMLASTDWTQLADAPVNKDAWSAYRQALRDVTSQSSFPFNIVWPEKPL
jgi:hypothetical protein